MFLLIFILGMKKNRNLACISSKQVILYFGTKPLTFLSQQIDKKHHFVKWTAKYVVSQV